jgi:hypothetical protein
MTQSDRIERYLSRVATAPWLISETHRLAVTNANTLQALQEQLDAASQAQLEALTLLTRAINELNGRLEKIIHAAERAGP